MILSCLASQNSVGLQKILQLLTSEDPDVQIHAVKVVANLAAEGAAHLPDIYILVDTYLSLSLSLWTFRPFTCKLYNMFE